MARNTEKIDLNEVEKTYVAVWETNEDIEVTNEVAGTQSDAILKLWNEGILENIYFDIQGTQTENTTIDFVFFVNVKDKNEAIEICDNLPFVINNNASYRLYYVGNFWLGEYDQ